MPGKIQTPANRLQSLHLPTIHCSYNSRFTSWRDKPRYTVDYAPPELLKDPNVVTYSPAVDIYGLGATLYTMFVGHAPYRLYLGDCGHGPEVHHKLRKRIEKESFNQRSKRWLNASTQLKQLISWCLQKDPAKRPKLSDILDSDWLQQNNDPDVDIIPPPEQVVVDLSEDTMEQPVELSIKQEHQKQLLLIMEQRSAAEMRIGVELPVGESAEELLADPTSNEDVLQGIFDPDFEALTDFHGFDELAPPLRLPSEYYTELPLPHPHECNVTNNPEPAALMLPPAAHPARALPPIVSPAEANKRPRTRQQRRTELRETAETPPEQEDSKAGLYRLIQQLPPLVDVLPVAKPIASPTNSRRSPRPLNDLCGFGKAKGTWRKSRASWRHFCLLLNGVQQVLKHRFKKERRVYCGVTIKAERLDEAYEKPLIFPRPRPPAQRKAKKQPKVPRPPTRVQPERARALRQRYVFE